MDLIAIIRELYAERASLNRVIADLEALARSQSAGYGFARLEQQYIPSCRDRGFMGVEERMTADSRRRPLRPRTRCVHRNPTRL